MGMNYFNKWEFQQALSILESNPYEARVRLEEYLGKYPKDYLAYPYYVSLLISFGEFDKADEMLDYVESISSRDKKFCSDDKKVDSLESNVLMCRMKILSYRGMYDELYKLYLSYYSKIESMDLNHIVFYCMKQVGKLTNEREQNSYLFRQIIEYQESDFLDHIQKHMAGKSTNKAVFVEDFPIDEIIKKVRECIPSDKRLYYGFHEDMYVFKYDNCGKNSNRLVDYFKVFCFHDTKDIITMFPTIEGENFPYIDLNHLVKNDKDTNARRLSRTDRFNRRFNLK